MLSVILPTYNPDLSRLKQALDSLKLQTLAVDQWELLIIDNNSSFRFTDQIDINWHPNGRIMTEPKQGLTFARLKGFASARGDMIIMVDDDNVLDKDYLQVTRDIFEANPDLGAVGGKSVPLFEGYEPNWLKDFYGNLALRDLGEEVIINSWENSYPAASPVGAGMGIRTMALANYISRVNTQENPLSDRTGTTLSSGGDNDIVLEILKSGWQVGYFPSLCLQHIIPRQRTEAAYLARLIKDTNKSWVKLLEYHRINPWKKIPAWSVPLRKLKAWFSYKAWQNKANYIRWNGACGMYEGLSQTYND